MSDRTKKPRIQQHELRGAKYLTDLMPLLQKLHGHEDHRNRQLHYDELVAYVLLYFFTPAIDSLRGLQQVSTLSAMKRRFGLKRFSLGSFSESARVFDPSLLEGILQELSAQLQSGPADPRLSALELAITAVDGTLIHALPKMTWALWLRDRDHAAKLHLQLRVLEGIAVGAAITDGNGDERTVLRNSLARGNLYLLDRGYTSYALLSEILSTGSSFVMRLASSAVYRVLEERPLGTDVVKAGIQHDQIVELGGPHTPTLHGRRLRIVEIRVPVSGPKPRRSPIDRKTKRFRTLPTEHHLLLVTDQLDLDAELIGLLYRYRWQIELFFRWFKKILEADHLLSLDRDGLTIITYGALIASMLVVLWTGRKPNKRAFELICLSIGGWLPPEELVERLVLLPRIGV